MRVLYITNYPVPYRVEFFNQLAQRIELTVLYQRTSSTRRDADWQRSVPIRHKHVVCRMLGSVVRAASRENDLVVVGCYNEVSDMGVASLLKALGRKYIVNVDGEYFAGRGVKKALRDRVVDGATGYLVAGESTGASLRRMVGDRRINPYHFSSLTEEELRENAKRGWTEGSAFLCVGQHARYKGLDVLVDAAAGLPEAEFMIVGPRDRSDELRSYIRDKGAANVEVVPFLGKRDLNDLYCGCKALILPSRQECWGLVVNEAASFGVPIIATRGVGAAADFLDGTPSLLAAPGDAVSLKDAISAYLRMSTDDKAAVSNGLLERSAGYSIERTVDEHVEAFRRVLRMEV